MSYSFKRTMFYFIIGLLFVSCTTKVYPDEKLAIDPNFSSLFYSVMQKDTIHFNNAGGASKTFIITNVDSIISNKRGWFINEKPYKLLRLKFRELGKVTVRLERENELFVNKDPEKNINTIGLQFANLYFHDSILPPVGYDTIELNMKKFTSYYSFQSTLALKSPEDVKVLYINASKAFIGFKTLSGEIWVNEGE